MDFPTNEELFAPVSCPKCQSKKLVIIESASGVFYEWGFNEDGSFDDGCMGNISGTSKYNATCRKCKHSWSIRKKISLAYPTNE